tara:strand:+ start:1571 stop:1855 length:285 start_codon:yes stop_codon:yes gene_type:complete
MYGTIFNLTVKQGHENEFLKLMEAEESPEGMIAWFVMKPDEKKDWIGIAIFENKEAHLANANSSKQNESFLKMMNHLESEPTWTDGNYVIGEIG